MATDWAARAKAIKAGIKKPRWVDDEERPTYRDQHKHWLVESKFDGKMRCRICAATELDVWFEEQGEIG
jgi:hypothetical protein